jgi:two-component system, NtrC family, sensor histidine kinase HydH
MFRVKSYESPTRFPFTVIIVVTTLVVALALGVTAVVQVLEEYRVLGDWLTRGVPAPLDDVRTLRRDIGTRIIVRSIASAVLLLCTLSTLWLQQRQLAVRRTLHEVRLLAHNILASLNQGVVTTDLAANVTSINSAAIELLGVDFDCVGQPIARISSADLPLDALSRRVTDRKPAVSDQELTLNRGLRVRRLVTSALDLKDLRGEIIGCVIHLRDVTERMLLKEQMWRMEQFASLNSLAAGLHHEIKNPITALSIHVQLLEERLGRAPVDAATSDMIGILKAEVRRLTITLESFRNFASLQRLDLKRVDVTDVLEEVVRLIRPQAVQQEVQLELAPSPTPLPRLPLDFGKFEQAVLNLVLNALEAMPNGGELSLCAAVEDGELRVVVRDSGPGIPPDIQDHIFHPYFSTKDRGTGIGLTIAEKVVRQHNGHLDFRTSHAGTSFSITLPVNEPIGSESGHER